MSTRTIVEPSNFRVHLCCAEAERHCQVTLPVAERVREEDVWFSKLFSAGRVACSYPVATVIVLQQCKDMVECSVEVAAPDEGVRSSQLVEYIEVARAPMLRESSRLRGGRIAIDGAHSLIGPPHMHTEKLEGRSF